MTPKVFEATKIDPLKQVICFLNENTHESLMIKTDAVQYIEIDKEYLSIVTMSSHHQISLESIDSTGPSAVGLYNTLLSLLR